MAGSRAAVQFLVSIVVVTGSHTRESTDGEERWKQHVKRCDMQEHVFRGPNGAPGYTEGTWVVQSEERKSILSMMPMECIEETTSCPIEGCDTTGVAAPSGYCAAFHDTCYKDRSSASFRCARAEVVRR
jgi:hypothetical protein